MLIHHVLPEENLNVSYLNKLNILCVVSSIFGKIVIDLQKIKYISIQKRRLDDNLNGSYQKIFININIGYEHIEYSFEISNQEKAVKFFQEIEKCYYANLKDERADVKEMFEKFGKNPIN